ncbi:MAG: S24/S26 family peptidase [Muribaculaceae bacterium]|nr:S24/S26 family peptidase [Muribaculaceae bacterium]
MKRHQIANDALLAEVCAALAAGKQVRLRAKGHSMRPLIRGDSDTLVLVPVTGLREGDVVLARVSDGSYVVHRIVGMRGDSITLMGDANLYRIEECRRKDICGKAVGVIRDGKQRSLTSFGAKLSIRLWRWLRMIIHRCNCHLIIIF